MEESIAILTFKSNHQTLMILFFLLNSESPSGFILCLAEDTGYHFSFVLELRILETSKSILLLLKDQMPEPTLMAFVSFGLASAFCCPCGIMAHWTEQGVGRNWSLLGPL